MKYYLVISAVLLLTACKNEDRTAPQTVASHEMTFSHEINVTTNRRVQLLPEARDAVSKWLAYVTAQNEMEALRKRSGHEILESAGSIEQIMENLRTTLPDTLRSPAVEARTNVLLTKGKLLHQLSRKKDKDPAEIYEVSNELITEFDNLKLQLNELFLKSPTDFEAELDQEFLKSTTGDTTDPA